MNQNDTVMPKSSIMNHFGKALRRIMRDKQMTNRSLAESAKISSSTINHAVKSADIGCMHNKTLRKISTALGYDSIDDLNHDIQKAGSSDSLHDWRNCVPTATVTKLEHDLKTRRVTETEGLCNLIEWIVGAPETIKSAILAKTPLDRATIDHAAAALADHMAITATAPPLKAKRAKQQSRAAS